MDIWATLIILVALIMSASRLVQTSWTTDLDIILNLTIIAAILGLALGYSRFSPNLVRVMTLAYSLFFIPWMFGLILERGQSWEDRLTGMAGRLQTATTQWVQGHSVPDPILFLLLMSLVFWIISAIATYMVTRHNSIWGAVIPSAVVMLFINHYDLRPGGDRLFIYYILLALLLIGRMTYLNHRQEWQSSGVFIMHETGSDIGRATIIAGVAIVLVVFSIPINKTDLSQFSKVWDDLTRPWETVRHSFSNAFTSLRSRNPVIQTVTFTDQLGLGTTISQSTQVVFTVVPSNPIIIGERFYWRARSYDTYLDGNWTSTITERKNFSGSNFNLTYPGSISNSGRTENQVTFYPQTPLQDILYTSGEPLFVNHASQAILTYLPDGNVDLEVLLSVPSVSQGDLYRERVSLSRPTIEAMQTAGSNYPDWVKSRYLQMPKGLSNRIPALAQQITTGMTNPYDKAQAITQYLRQTITYNGSLPVPPSNEDPLEWFLFDLKQGYCNYYASAEIIMLRSVGIPARLAVGFAQGQYDAQTNMYTIRQKDSHAWPEVYFNGLGWVEFEPTVSQPARDWLPNNNYTGTETAPTENLDTLRQTLEAFNRGGGGGPPNIPQASNPGPSQATRTALIVIGSLASVAAISLLSWRFILPLLRIQPLPLRIENFLRKRGLSVPSWLHRWSLSSTNTPFERAYIVIGRAIRLMGQPLDIAQTPAERVTTLTTLLPETLQPANTFLTEYQRAQYSPYPGDLGSVRLASQKIQRLAFRAFFRRLFNRSSRRAS